MKAAQTDIMKIKKEDLPEKLEEYTSDKNGDLSTHLNEGYIVRVHFSKDNYTATDALRHYLKQIAELKY